MGVSDRLRPGDGDSFPSGKVLGPPPNEGNVGEPWPSFNLGLVGGVNDAVEGRS